MKLIINGVPLTFENYQEVSKAKVKEQKHSKMCNEEGVEVVWKAGLSGHYETMGGVVVGRTGVYLMGSDGKPMPKNERTSEIHLESCKRARKDFMENEVVPCGEKFCVEDKGVFKDLKDNECIVVEGLQLSESNDKDTKLGVFYRDKDGTITLRVGAPELKSVQKKAFVSVKSAVVGLQKKKLVKKAKLSIDTQMGV
jgi:hypothetical protein